MVAFDIVTVNVDADSTKEQLERNLHPAIRVLIRTERSTRWIQVNLDEFRIVNACWVFNGILSHTIYANQTTFHQESDIHGWYSLENQIGALTIF